MECECGCGGVTNLIAASDATHGLVRGARRRFIAGHQSRKSHLEYLVDNETGCWVWQRGRTAAGYGQTRVEGVRVYAHRAFYERERGPIPKSLVIDHLCRNPACVNPSHLEAVQQHTNAHRGDKTRLTHAAVEAIRASVAAGRRTAGLALEFGVSASHIRSICKGARWASAPGPVVDRLPQRGRRIAVAGAEVRREIRRLRASGMRLSEVAALFGLSQSYVSQIATGALGW